LLLVFHNLSPLSKNWQFSFSFRSFILFCVTCSFLFFLVLHLQQHYSGHLYSCKEQYTLAHTFPFYDLHLVTFWAWKLCSVFTKFRHIYECSPTLLCPFWRWGVCLYVLIQILQLRICTITYTKVFTSHFKT
jgi:hypothetical protein